MIVSMTGFGDATAQRDGTHYAIEIRSLNNRYFKPVIKLPDSVAGLEPELENMLRQRLVRGSITFILKMRTDSAAAAYHINVEALQSYLTQLQSVSGLEKMVRIDLAGLVELPGVCQEPGDDSNEISTHGEIIKDLAEKAVAKLMGMRQREGELLCANLLGHVKSIAENLAGLQGRAPFVIADYHKRLSQRVNQLMSEAKLKLDEGDLIREVALFADRADISEEIQRLNSHLLAFEHSCGTSEHAGRKLDFLTQEMLREANTIASKANDAVIATHVVEIKGLIDRLKEQVQNVE